MEKLRKSLVDPNTYPLFDADLSELLVEWTKISRAELKGWFLYQIIAAFNRKIIDPDIFISVAISYMQREKSRDFFPLIGAALRNGADPNIYLDAPILGPAHVLVYAVYQNKKNNVPAMEIDALCIMFLLMGSKTNINAFDDGGASAPVNFVEDGNYNRNLVSQVSRVEAQSQYKDKIRTVTVLEWLMGQGVGPFDNYIVSLKMIGGHVPAMVGTSISNYNIAFMNPQHIPSFEYLINCQADGLPIRTMGDSLGGNSSEINKNYSNTGDNLFANYPLNNNGRHTRIVNGEVVGMIQSIQGASLAGFKLFLDAGVECSYFIINRLCYHISEACKNFDPVYYAVLVEILKLCIAAGTTIDNKQLDLMRLGDSKSKYGIVSMVEKEYMKPKWSKICSGSLNARVPDSLKQLAFSLGLDRDQPKEKLCSDLRRIDSVDVSKVREAAIKKQRDRISVVSQYFGDEKTYDRCSNSSELDGKPIPEEYNDVFMSFYRDGPDVFCYTSVDYKDMIATGKDLSRDKQLPEDYIRQLKSHLDIIKSLDLNPANPISIPQAVDILKKNDNINMENTDFASNTIIKIIEAEKLSVVNTENVQTGQLNNVLNSISIYQDLLPRLQPSHQVATFYQAVYFVLRQEPSKTSLFLNSYRDRANIKSNNFNDKPSNSSPEIKYTGSYSAGEREEELKVMEGGIQTLNPTILVNESRKILPPVPPPKTVIVPVQSKVPGPNPKIKTAEPVKQYVRTQTMEYSPTPEDPNKYFSNGQYIPTQYTQVPAQQIIQPVQYVPVQINKEGKYIMVKANELSKLDPATIQYVAVQKTSDGKLMTVPTTNNTYTTGLVQKTLPASQYTTVNPTDNTYPPEYYATPGSYAKYLQQKQINANQYPNSTLRVETPRQEIQWSEFPYASMKNTPDVITYPPGN